MDAEVSQEAPPRRASRKSVAFTEETLVVDADGKVTMEPNTTTEESTAQSHAPSTPPLHAALGDFANSATAAADPADDNELDLGLLKKKKKSKKVAAEEKPAEDDESAAADEALLSGLKKKKKKPKTDDDFAKRLEALNLDQEASQGADGKQEGDPDAGTGVWEHDQSSSINYDLLLSRFFGLLAKKNPDHASSGSKSYKIPPPQCLREGNKKTIFANIAEICKRMKRTEEHVTAYLFAELGTSGSVDGSRRLVIKGRFQQKQIEAVLRTYILEYVTCKTCRSPDTSLEKGENRLYFITCNSCGSRRSVQAIKTGFSAQVGKRRKMQG